ncbi:uncharacterized protein [Triticum aestivum]|uniref:uncharacterized protein isoform X2 n=1 Tax=Triticum aestivum TaxID=4565 RepID=UPI001D035722|nr:uncharacterized protein LOC123069712 isoform X2 [Triticum aestivum]
MVTNEMQFFVSIILVKGFCTRYEREKRQKNPMEEFGEEQDYALEVQNQFLWMINIWMLVRFKGKRDTTVPSISKAELLRLFYPQVLVYY